jgi:cytochrome c oxidase subunit 2
MGGSSADRAMLPGMRSRLPFVVLTLIAVLVPACSGSSGDDDATTEPSDLSAEAAAGKAAVADLGCSTCHSVDGKDGVGPTFKGLAGSEVELEDGSTVTADEAYLTRSINDPKAQVVKGFKPIMPERKLPADEVASIVAYLKALG